MKWKSDKMNEAGKIITGIYSWSLIFDIGIKMPKNIFIWHILACNFNPNFCMGSSNGLWSILGLISLFIDTIMNLNFRAWKTDLNIYSRFLFASTGEHENVILSQLKEICLPLIPLDIQVR
jgi:hypothetical protein